MYNHLTREQRYAIYLGLQEGKSLKAIARQINVHPSTVSREISRNSTRCGHYSWRSAHENAVIRGRHLPGNRHVNYNIKREALSLLRNEDWSPRQISGYLALKGDRVSHETIYKWIRADKTGELSGHCRHRMKYRRHVRLPAKTRVRNIPDRISIHDRPKEADGSRFGDWEMDLIIGKGQKSAILTLCERSVNYLIMERLPYGKNPDKVADTVIRLLMPYRKNVLTIQPITELNLHATGKSPRHSEQRSFLQTHMPHGRKGLSKT